LTGRAAAVFVVAVSLGVSAHAGERALDARDLPPIPDVAVDEQARSSLTVFAATQAGEEVVVGAAKREQSLGSVASAVTVLSGDRLRRFGYRTVAEALRGAAGLFIVDDRMTERLGIRGLQILDDFNTRILVLVDGATLNEPWNQFVGIGLDLPVNIDDVERIEVVRGPVSSVYGTNAFFGIINIVTRGADRAPRAYGRMTATTFGTYGGSAGFAVGDVNRQLRGSVFYETRGGETIDVPQVGTTSADGADAMNASLVGHWDGAFAQVRAYRRLRELPGAPFDSTPGAPGTHNIDQMIMAEGGYTRDVGDLTLSARGYLNRYQFQDYLVQAPDFTDTGDSTWLGAELRAHARLGAFGLTAGIEAAYDDVASRSFAVGDEKNATEIPTTINVEGLYGEVEWAPRDWLSATAGVRYDLSSLFENRVSPRGALLLHDGERVGLKLLYARGFRAPSPIEAFFYDGMSQIANPALRPETIASYEAVAWGRPFPGLSLRLSGFWWDLSDILELQPTAADPMIKQFQNVATIRSRGVEAEATYRDARGLYGFASATVAVVERDGSTDAALNAPTWVLTAGLSSPALFDVVHLSGELEAVGARRTRDPTHDSPAHVGLNLALYLPAWRGLDVTVGLRNLLGTREEVPAQGDYDRVDGTVQVPLIPGEGREVYARVGYSL
jgi:iron complex outermembrane receptor protein